jgi:hypothetical protein
VQPSAGDDGDPVRREHHCRVHAVLVVRELGRRSSGLIRVPRQYATGDVAGAAASGEDAAVPAHLTSVWPLLAG